MVVQVAGDNVPVAAAGGTADGRLGTNAEAIVAALRAILAESGDGVLVLLDLGSAWLSVEVALEELSDTERARIHVSEAPLVEGAVLAAVQASVGGTVGSRRGSSRCSFDVQGTRRINECLKFAWLSLTNRAYTLGRLRVWCRLRADFRVASSSETASVRQTPRVSYPFSVWLFDCRA